MRRTILLLLAAALGAGLTSGCASGPEYSRNKSSPALQPAKDKAMVLLYWQGGMGGTATRWVVYANDKELTRMMRRGAFYSYQASPGELKLATKQAWNVASLSGANLFNQIPKDQAALQVAPNQTYYLEMSFGMWREKIRQVSATEGEEGIADCHWINPPQK